MATARSRIDFVARVGEKVLRVTSNLRDQVEYKKLGPNSQVGGDGMAITIAWLAFKRTGQFEGDLDAFLDQVDDLEVTTGDDLPPLVEGPSNI